MKCAQCGTDCKVRNTRKSDKPKNKRLIPSKYFKMYKKDFTYRDYYCPNCGNTFQTIETIFNNPEDSLPQQQDLFDRVF